MRSTTTTRKLIIFTDLDGTLLDRETTSFEGALPALRLVREKGIPLILSSSKTRAEMELYREKLENSHPFVSENGGAVFLPKGYFSFPFPYDRELEAYFVLELGTFYPVILEALDSIKRETGIPIRGFFDLTGEELGSLCGLSPQEAGFARKREYDEPFLVEGGIKEVEIVKKKVEEKGFSYVWGGRFHHISGTNDKGKAAAILTELYKKEFLSVSTVGIGDSPNDLPLLLAVDQPIFLNKSQDALPELVLSSKKMIIIDGSGPQVWNRAIRKVIE